MVWQFMGLFGLSFYGYGSSFTLWGHLVVNFSKLIPHPNTGWGAEFKNFNKKTQIITFYFTLLLKNISYIQFFVWDTTNIYTNIL